MTLNEWDNLNIGDKIQSAGNSDLNVEVAEIYTDPRTVVQWHNRGHAGVQKVLKLVNGDYHTHCVDNTRWNKTI